jgi:lysophospholipase L1-like esterase
MISKVLFAVCCAFVAQNLHADEAAKLPRVLIIGDSISLGYTPHVVQMLKGKAIVKHNPGNAQHTSTGLKKLDAWIGKEKWDVIHFNWGLWDLCYRNPTSKNQGRRDKVGGKLTTSVEDFEKNLDKLTARLKQTDARLIWAHITFIPEGEAGRKQGDDAKYNAAAARVMKKHGVEINDLLSITKKFEPKLFSKPGDVHYTKVGYAKIASAVVKAIQK